MESVELVWTGVMCVCVFRLWVQRHWRVAWLPLVAVMEV